MYEKLYQPFVIRKVVAMRKIVNFVLFVIFMKVTGFMYINPSLTSFGKKHMKGIKKRGC